MFLTQGQGQTSNRFPHKELPGGATEFLVTWIVQVIVKCQLAFTGKEAANMVILTPVHS